MLKNIILHELKNIMLAPKFVVTFLIISILLLLSVYLGIQNYKYSVKQYDTVTRLSNQELREKSDWLQLSTKTHRKPDPMQVFVSGISNDIGRYSNVNSFENINLVHSNYSDDPVFAVFRFIDFSFIATVVLSLFTILFTYDAVNGESERGTLQLLFSNAVPRRTFILGKFLGIWSGLIIPLTIPLLLSILLILLFNVPFTPSHWGRFSVLIFASLCLYTFFIVAGILISTLTKRTAVSFLISLAAWIIFVFIIPRAGIMAASQVIKTPGFAEIQGKQSQYEKERWDKYLNDSQKRWINREALMKGMPEDERSAERDAKQWEWMEEEDRQRKDVQTDIDNNNKKLIEEYRNKKIQQEQLGFLLSRLSPVSAYQLAVMNVALTDINLKTRFEDGLNRYRDEFISYKEKKQKESGEVGGLRIMISPAGLKIETSRDKGSLNLSDMPRFSEGASSFNDMLSSSVMDMGFIVLVSLILFGISYISFMRYDIR